jgi:hypothetical protein
MDSAHFASSTEFEVELVTEIVARKAYSGNVTQLAGPSDLRRVESFVGARVIHARWISKTNGTGLSKTQGATFADARQGYPFVALRN